MACMYCPRGIRISGSVEQFCCHPVEDFVVMCKGDWPSSESRLAHIVQVCAVALTNDGKEFSDYVVASASSSPFPPAQ